MNVKIKNNFDKFSTHVKVNRKKIIIRYIVFLTILLIFLLIDQLTKLYVFKHGSVIEDTKMLSNGTLQVKNPFYIDPSQTSVTGREYVFPETILPFNPKDWLNHSIIGVRSIWHRGVTFLPDTVNIELIQAISMIIFIFTLFIPLLTRNWFLIVFIAIISSGAMGNMLDRFIFIGYVKDLFYFPFLEKDGIPSTGTFNFADVSVIIGASGTVLTLILEQIIEFIKAQKKKKHNNDSQQYLK